MNVRVLASTLRGIGRNDRGYSFSSKTGKFLWFTLCILPDKTTMGFLYRYPIRGFLLGQSLHGRREFTQRRRKANRRKWLIREVALIGLFDSARHEKRKGDVPGVFGSGEKSEESDKLRLGVCFDYLRDCFIVLRFQWLSMVGKQYDFDALCGDLFMCEE